MKESVKVRMDKENESKNGVLNVKMNKWKYKSRNENKKECMNVTKRNKRKNEDMKVTMQKRSYIFFKNNTV